jgi:peptidyl-prolyl cis-trans isomerase NIMA-interacting 1
MMLRVCRFLLLCFVSLAACAPAIRKQPRQRLPVQVAEQAAPTDAGAPQPAPELVEVRVLVVAHEGATGAREDVKRTKEQALERAHMLARMGRSGDKFAELVRKYSDRPGASEDFGLFRIRPAQPGAFGKEVADATLALTPGSISEPVETPQGYFVIERRNDPPAGPQRVSAKHILISYKGAEHAMPGVTRSEEEARTLAQQIAKSAKEPGADWSALAQHTDEPGSKETGGDLGAFQRGQMVGAFERAAFALKVGEVSEVVQTPFGFHVIQRYE